MRKDQFAVLAVLAVLVSVEMVRDDSVLRQGTPQMAQHSDLATQQLQLPMSVPKTMVPKTHLSGETREAEASNCFWRIRSLLLF